MSASSLPLPQGKSVSLKQFVSRHINEIGLLVVIPALNYSIYVAYRDIFLDESEEAQPPVTPFGFEA